MSGISLDKAQIIAIFLETFLYGIFFTLFCITLYVLFSKTNGRTPVNRPLVFTSFVMMFLATAHIIIDFIRIIEAFITKRDTIKGGPNGYYSELSNPLLVAKTAFYVTQTLTGDTLVTWRCFVINGRKRSFIIVPTLLLVASAVSGYIVSWSLSTAKPGNSIFQTAAAWITSFFVLTLCTNLYCTSSIVYRIWSSSKAIGEYRLHSLTPVLLAVVESGALYSSALVALLVTFLSGSNGQYPALDVVQPLVGIVFSLIIIQISVYNETRNKRTTSSAPWGSNIVFQKRLGRATAVDTYPMQTISVEITKGTHADREEINSQTPITGDLPHDSQKLAQQWHSA